MTTNKSIDGLSTHAAKTTAKSSGTKQTKRSMKTTAPEDFVSEPDSNIWDSIKLDGEVEVSTVEVEEKLVKSSPKKSSKKTMDITPKKKPRKNEDFTADFLKPIQAFDFNEEEGLIESSETVKELKDLSSEEKSEDEDSEDDAINQEPSKKQLKAEKKKLKKLAKAKQKADKKPSKKRRVITITALVIVLLLIGFVLWLIFWGNDIIAKITGGRGNVFDLFTFTSETYEPLKTDVNGRTNILAFGTGGYDMNGEEGGGVHDGAQLTDSIMLISFDQNTGDVAMVSLPRDLKGPSTCTSTGKINEVYWCNGGDGDITIEEEEKAATALMEAVGSILGVDIQYFAHLNWGSLASIVDILGGITVTLDEDINDYEYTGAVYEAGVPYNINGAEAVGLARARHGTESGDFSRGASQQKIIVGIKDKVLSNNLSISDLLGLVNTLGDNLRTNFSVSELKTLAHMPSVLDFDVMRQISLYPDYMTTGMINGISYVLPKGGAGYYGAIQAFINKQLSSDPRDYEEPTIAIYNASNTDGLASSERNKLEEKGYTITTIDNAPAGEYENGTSVYAITDTKPGTKNLLEEEYGYEAKSKEELPVTIAPDYDFIIILND